MTVNSLQLKTNSVVVAAVAVVAIWRIRRQPHTAYKTPQKLKRLEILQLLQLRFAVFAIIEGANAKCCKYRICESYFFVGNVVTVVNVGIVSWQIWQWQQRFCANSADCSVEIAAILAMGSAAAIIANRVVSYQSNGRTALSGESEFERIHPTPSPSPKYQGGEKVQNRDQKRLF